MAQYAFYVDSTRCTGCKTCQIACQDKFDLPVGLTWRHVADYNGGGWEMNEAGSYVPQGVFRYFLSFACNHCADPACTAVCPTGAMQKDPETGIVWTDHDVCIGCGSCRSACPYHAPILDEAKGYMTKCTMCGDKVLADGKPECVLACPQRALDWGELEELAAAHPDAVCDVEPLPMPTTSPSLLINAHAKAQKSGEGTGKLANPVGEF